MDVKSVLIEPVVVGPLEVNAYIVFESGSTRGLLVDPGDDAARILSRLTDLGVEIEAVLLTHGHLDHWAALGDILAKKDVPVYMHPDDRFLLRHEVNRSLAASLGWKVFDFHSRPLLPGPLSLSGMDLEVLSTPGHSPGSVVLLFDDCLLTGDTLFAGGIGRSDLPGGDGKVLFESMAVFKKMPSHVRIFPGHGESSDLGAESRYNPFW
jgi:glyoxylase-like metal-dependent hydrolase (beta-lactamase superfamily II)